MSDKVRYELLDGGVVVITIARPEVRNAMDLDVFRGLRDAGERAGADPAVRAVVVTGEGNFSSGIDTTIFSGGSGSGIAIAELQDSFTVFERIGKPVVAAVAGPAFGAGFQLAIACDLRVLADDARLSVMEVRWGIIPDLGGTTRLPRLVGLGRARELCYTAREIGPDEALAWGLANRVEPAADLLDRTVGWATELAGGPPLALAAIKRLTGSAFDLPVATGLEREEAAQRRLLASADFVEAVTARIERRAPRYSAR